MSVTVDGAPRHDRAVPLVDDRREHSGEVRIDAAPVFGLDNPTIRPCL